MATLNELTSVLRSKNAGALLCTMDLMFEDTATYERVRDSGVLTPAYIATLYGVSDNEVSIIPYDVAIALRNSTAEAMPKRRRRGLVDVHRSCRPCIA